MDFCLFVLYSKITIKNNLLLYLLTFSSRCDVWKLGELHLHWKYSLRGGSNISSTCLCAFSLIVLKDGYSQVLLQKKKKKKRKEKKRKKSTTTTTKANKEVKNNSTLKGNIYYNFGDTDFMRGSGKASRFLQILFLERTESKKTCSNLSW